jgi:phosphoadenosine phosphosulfate reductase
MALMTRMNGTSVAIELPQAEGWSAEDVLSWAFEHFGRSMAIASAFGVEGMVLIDLASRLRPDFRVFTLDTGFFFPETYALIGETERRYGIRVERCRPALRPDEQARSLGEALWSRDPQRCCELRKIDPLRRKLSELEAWATAIRRDQTEARAWTSKVEWDSKFGLVKMNPLADWTWQQVWEYVRAHHVPYNPLHDRNYPSIGCTHCTRAIAPGDDLRAGRWPGFQKTECGLHGAAAEPASR